MEEVQLSIKQNIIFFFGAGASVDAGIPDTYAFARDFEEYIKNSFPKLIDPLSSIMKKRKDFNERTGLKKKEVDVEQLLDILRRLINIETEPLLEFYENKPFCTNLGEYSVCPQLKRLLENFIREKVIIENPKKLEYLKELLKFDSPIEIYTTNYDTCIEQLSYISHRGYTDGFNIYWNEKNFDPNFDIKHYKMHGSVIWYENVKTKECVKIPAHAFVEGKPVQLKLIFGEYVEPLLIYPAQKAEYIEPLTDLQLMFKKRLFNENTKFVVVVGYSFKDDYVIRMLWDAGRANDNLRIILISPSAHEIFEEKLKYTNKTNKDLSSIHDKVLCLPYPFGTIIYKLKTGYLHSLQNICSWEEQYLQTERGYGTVDWPNLLRMCIEGEFLSKAEYILEEKIRNSWNELNFETPATKLTLGFKGLLHSVIAKDGNELVWLYRVNDSLQVLNASNLKCRKPSADSFVFEFKYQNNTYSIEDISNKWIDPVLNERDEKLKFLTSKYEHSLRSVTNSFKDLERLRSHLDHLKGVFTWFNYLELRRDHAAELSETIERLKTGLPIEEKSFDIMNCIELTELKRIYDGEKFQFKLERNT